MSSVLLAHSVHCWCTAVHSNADARLTESRNARSEQVLRITTEQLTDWEWLPGEHLNGLECSGRPGWFLDMEKAKTKRDLLKACHTPPLKKQRTRGSAITHPQSHSIQRSSRKNETKVRKIRKVCMYQGRIQDFVQGGSRILHAR